MSASFLREWVDSGCNRLFSWLDTWRLVIVLVLTIAGFLWLDGLTATALDEQEPVAAPSPVSGLNCRELVSTYKARISTLEADLRACDARQMRGG